MAMADRRNFFEDIPTNDNGKTLLPTTLYQQGARFDWKPLVTGAGWYLRHECGRLVHQWNAPTRVFHVQCSGCRKWTPAP